MTLRQGVEIKLTGDPTKELRFLLGPGGLPRGYPWRGYDGPKRRLKNFIAGGAQMPAEANRVDPAPPNSRTVTKYDSDAVRRKIESKGAAPNIPPKIQSMLEELLLTLALPSPQRHRTHVRSAQRLSPDRHSLRSPRQQLSRTVCLAGPSATGYRSGPSRIPGDPEQRTSRPPTVARLEYQACDEFSAVLLGSRIIAAELSFEPIRILLKRPEYVAGMTLRG